MTDTPSTPLRLELYYFPQSSPSRSVIWFLEAHKSSPLLTSGKVVIDRKIIALPKQEFLSEEYTAINKYQTVPALRDVATGKTYTESGAILFYLAKLLDSPFLPPAEDFAATTAILEALLHHESLARNVSAAQRRALNAGKAKPDEITLAQQREMVEADGWSRVEESLFLLEKVLSEHTFVAGNQFSIADFIVLGELSRLRPFVALVPTGMEEEELVQKYPKVFAYVAAAVESREGWADFVKPLDNFKAFIAKV